MSYEKVSTFVLSTVEMPSLSRVGSALEEVRVTRKLRFRSKMFAHGWLEARVGKAILPEVTKFIFSFR